MTDSAMDDNTTSQSFLVPADKPKQPPVIEINDAEELRKAGSCCPNMKPFVLMIGLSVHSIFEGLAVGLAPTLSATLTLVIAIVVHKGAAAAALGISLVKTYPEDLTLCRWLIFTFSVATPLGVIMGIFLGQSDVLGVIFNSLTCGTFVYIACSEIIVEEFTVPGTRGWKLLAFFIGSLLIFSLWFLP